MARVEKTETWTAASDPDTVRSAAEQFLATNAMKVTSTDPDAIRAKQGSHAVTRLAGGWFVKATKLPKSASISFAPDASGTSVSAHIEESMGPGLLDPKLKKKYEEYFNSWITGLKAALK